ncbi:uncharacterized protein LOC134233044 [Saccostrea cucullata]|uniref:uncharacterized protein LOC134233044 n=1 Tax=Saccostrea cuccullata TaxID=36930 RepID=UPI002ED2DC51
MNSHVVFRTLLPLIMFSWKAENLGVNTCTISDEDVENHKQHFNDLSLLGKGMQFVYVNISSPSFANFTLNMTAWNKVIDWIWITHEYRHYLSYPVDIDLFTLGLMKQNVRTLNLNVSIQNISHCHNETLWIKIYEYLFKIYNSSNGYFCHRYFEDQEWKELLFFMAHVSVGYEFHCFNGPDVSSPFTVKKSSIIYITVAMILIIISYYPMLLSRSMHERKVRRELVVYTRADYPYTPRRFFLRIMFQTGELKSEKICEFQKNLLNCFSATRLSILISIVTVTAFIVKFNLINYCEVCLHPNAHLFQEIYITHGVSDQTVVSIVLSTIVSFLALSALNNSIMVISHLYCGCFLGCCNDINCDCSSPLMNENEVTEGNNPETQGIEENRNEQGIGADNIKIEVNRNEEQEINTGSQNIEESRIERENNTGTETIEEQRNEKKTVSKNIEENKK